MTLNAPNTNSKNRTEKFHWVYRSLNFSTLFVFSVKRVREKYETELQELERSEKVALEKHQEMRKRQSELEGENLRLQSLLKQREQEITDVTQVNDARYRRSNSPQCTQTRVLRMNILMLAQCSS